MNNPTPTSFGSILSGMAARVLGSLTGKIIAALFVAFQIYLIAFIPAWRQFADLQVLWPKLEIAQREADAAKKKQEAEAAAISEQSKIRIAEANNAALQAKADADKLEAEAITAGEVANVSPEMQDAIARKLKAEAEIQLGRARASRDQTKAAADKMEAEARVAQAKAQQAKTLADARIESARQRARAALGGISMTIGLPIPVPLRFDPKSPNG